MKIYDLVSLSGKSMNLSSLRRNTSRNKSRWLYSFLLMAFLLIYFSGMGLAKEKRIIVAGGNKFIPFIFLNARGEPEGMDVDLWRLWSHKSGVDIELKLMDWATAIPALLEGKVDVVDGVTYTPKRAEYLDFSSQYGEMNVYIYFHESIGGIRKLDDLEGFPVGVIRGTNVVEFVTRKASGLRLVPYVNHEQMVQAALGGGLRAFIGEDPLIPYFFAKAGQKGGFRRTQVPLVKSELRMAVQKGDSALLNIINEGLGSITAAEKRKILRSWTGLALASRIPWKWLTGVAGALFLFIILLITWNTLLRKRVSEATRTLRDSEERFRALVETTSDWIWEMDQKGHYTYVSPRVGDLLGYAQAEVEGKTPFDFMPHRKTEKIRSMIKKIMASRAPIEGLEYENLDKNGETVILEKSGVPIFDVSGKFKGYRGIDRDVTQRKRSEEALKEAYDIINRSPAVAFLWKNAQGWPVEFVSDNVENVFGYKAEDFISGKLTYAGVVHPDDLTRVAQEVRTYSAESGRINFKHAPYRIVHKHGDVKWLDDMTFIRRDDEGHITHYQGIVLDINERMASEKERNQLENQLRKKEKMESIGLMAGGVAHDLNNILSGIASYPDLLLMELPKESPLKKPIETIKEAGQRAAEVVSDLLTISKGAVVDKEVLNLNTMVEEYFGCFQHRKLEKMGPSITFRMRLDPDLLNTYCSASHIKKTLTNLVMNACEAIEGPGCITVSTTNRYLDEPLRGYDDVREGEYVLLSVADDGTGITPEDVERIFEPFYSKKILERKGTGLGLAIVWNTVRDHLGYIHVSSGEKGTKFELYFPATRDEVTTGEKRESFNEYMGHGEKILVVDDEENQREIACSLLARLGYKVEAVASGAQAVEYLKENTVDLVILDMIMPKGINGRKTYEQIIKIRPNQKAIITSGFAETDDVKATQKLGAGQYIRKPYTLAKIGMVVRQALDRPAV